MKIYFEDGMLVSGVAPPMAFWVDAARGSEYCFNLAKHIQSSFVGNVSIYTNDLIILLNASEFAWNGDTFEIYLRNTNDEWKLLKELTNRELRQGHNIYRLWFAGEFSQALNSTKENGEVR